MISHVDVQELIEAIGTTYDPKLDFQSRAQVLLRRARAELGPWVPAGYVVHGSGGQGTTAFVPWIAIFDPDETTSAQRGMYVVYLFAIEFRTVILSLNQGVTDLVRQHGTARGRALLAKEAQAIRGALPVGARKGLDTKISLPTTAARPGHYMYGNIVAKTYQVDDLPPVADMLQHLRCFVTLYQTAQAVREKLRRTTIGVIVTRIQTGAGADDPPFVPEFKPKSDSDYFQQVQSQWLRKTRKHENLVDQYGRYLKSRGFKLATNVHPRDMIAMKSGQIWLIEAKMVRRGDGVGAAREALGQLMAYRFFHHHTEPVSMVAVFNESVGQRAVDLLESQTVCAVWAEDGVWKGGARACQDALCQVAG